MPIAGATTLMFLMTTAILFQQDSLMKMVIFLSFGGALTHTVTARFLLEGSGSSHQFNGMKMKSN